MINRVFFFLVPVAFFKDGHGAGLHGLFSRQDRGAEREILADGAVHLLLHFLERLCVHLGKVAEVEAEPLRRDQGAGLLHMRAQDFSQGRMEQVGGRVVEGRGPALGFVHSGLHPGACRDGALLHHPAVNDKRFHEFGRVGDLNAHPVAHQPTPVSHLTACLSVEGSPVEDHLDLFACNG